MASASQLNSVKGKSSQILFGGLNIIAFIAAAIATPGFFLLSGFCADGPSTNFALFACASIVTLLPVAAAFIFSMGCLYYARRNDKKILARISKATLVLMGILALLIANFAYTTSTNSHQPSARHAF